MPVREITQFVCYAVRCGIEAREPMDLVEMQGMLRVLELEVLDESDKQRS